MDHAFHGHPPQSRRRALADATSRANEDNSAQRRLDEKTGNENTPGSSLRAHTLPHNESLVPNGTLKARHGLQPSPQDKRVSAVISDDLRPRNTKRDSEISNASTNASNTARRRKSHIGPWELGRTIGRGGCSRVRLVRHGGNGMRGAAKIISKDTAEQVRALSLANLIESAEHDPTLAGGKVIPFGLEREICIMKLLDHPNIVRLHDVWENRNELYLIMEYVEGGELFQYIEEQQMLREIEVVYLFRQIIAALLYCHRLNIHHRDLKPENILMDRQNHQIKLVDFGMAALQPVGKKLTTPCGSPHYAAPEVIRSPAYDGGKADIWSCGVILFVMLTGYPPFNYTGDEADLKQLFRSIAMADYRMPSELSREAQDLIRKILVPDPKRRITIESIWKHPFLRKYNTELDFRGVKTTIDYWVKPLEPITDWKALNRLSIDREILRYLRTLWHSEKEEVLVQRLLSKEPNQEKYFYSALQKYHHDQLEDYSPGPYAVGYSNSDHHHHVKYAPTSHDLLQMPSRKHIRSQSGYSILNDEHLYSKHSFYDPPPSDGSYDPFRASRDPIIPEQTSDRNVTVHRGSDGGSRRVRPVTALGHRSGSSLRILALKNSKHQSGSIRSRNSSKRSNPSTRSQHSSIAARRRSISRSSMASSHWPSSPPVIVHPGSLGKRGVSFSHLRRSSITSGTTAGTAGPHYTPEQRRFLNGSRDSAAVSVLSSPRPPQVRLLTKPVASPILPRLRVRKPESPSKYINTEARKVSMELVKVMDEAFNRSSIGSSIRTTATELNTNKEMPEYDSPPTSFTITRDSGASAIATPLPRAVLQNRPLPPIPNETPNTFLQRKLAETRAEIARRIEHDGDNTEHFNEVLERLDQLMLPVTTGAKRTSSAPAKSPEQPHILPVIEEVKDGEDRPAHQVRRAVTESIRVVDHSPTPIAPLNIRKRSGASTASSRSVNEDVAVPWPGPLPPKTAYDDSAQAPSIVQPTRTYQGVRNDLLAARASGTLNPSLAPSVTGDKDNTIKKKRSLWFRRNPDDKEKEKEAEQAQEGPSKSDNGRLQIPDAWKTLDDRTEKALPPPGPAPQHQAKRSEGSTSSEFPMRNCGTSASRGDSNKERKGFFGFFGKKSKENKGKSPIEIGSVNWSSSSILSGYDIADDAPGSGARAPDVGTNWLSRFLHIRPASKILCFQIGRGKVRQDLVRLLHDWQRFGVRDVTVDRQTNIITARVDKNNHLKIKPVSLVIELFVVLESGRRANLCLARFTQTKGAASSFKKVVDIVEDVCRSRSLLVEDEAKKNDICAVLDFIEKK